MAQGVQVPADQPSQKLGGVVIAQGRAASALDSILVLQEERLLGHLTHLSLLSLMMTVSAPKNLTFSSGCSSRWRIIDHACGELWNCDRVACVVAITPGGFG